MREIERYGVKMDICPTSGGIWLDKGELEKIIMMIRQEALEEQAPPPLPSGGHQGYSDHRDDYHRETRHSGRERKRGSLFDNLMDIFD